MDETALDRLVELGEGHPRATMRIAQQTHLRAVQLETYDIGSDLVELGYQAAMEGDKPIMEQTLSRIRAMHKDALAMVRAVAAGKPPPKHVTVGVRDRLLKQMRDAGIIEKVGHGRWRVINPLFRAYLQQSDELAS